MSGRRQQGDCPVVIQSRQVLEETQRLAISMRQLRRSLRNCQRCECAASCTFIQTFNAQFEAALHHVMEEWDLASTL